MDAWQSAIKVNSNLRTIHLKYKEKSRKFVNGLDEKDREVIGKYQAARYAIMNELLYKGYALGDVPLLQIMEYLNDPDIVSNSEVTAFKAYVKKLKCRFVKALHDDVKRLDALFTRTMKFTEAVTVFRGVSGYLAETIQKTKKAVDVRLDGFMSTSFDPFVSAKFTGQDDDAPEPEESVCKCCVLIVKVPQGTPAIYMDGSLDEVWENELLLPRGCVLRVHPKKHVLPDVQWKHEWNKERSVIAYNAEIVSFEPSTLPDAPHTDKFRILVTTEGENCS